MSDTSDPPRRGAVVGPATGETPEGVIRVAYPLWSHPVLRLGWTVITIGLAVWAWWGLAIERTHGLKAALWLLVVGGLAWALWLGWRLLAFVGATAEADVSKITVRRGHDQRVYRWTEVSARVRARLQMIEIRDAAGTLVYAVDRSAPGALALARLIRGLQRGDATGAPEQPVRPSSPPQVLVARRFWAIAIGFLGLPLLLAEPVWWPLLFGSAEGSRDRLEASATVLIRLTPSLAVCGAVLCGLFRHRFFDSLGLTLLVGLVSGAMASAVTYFSLGQAIVNPLPFFTTMPLTGVACAMLSYALAAHWEGRVPPRETF